MSREENEFEITERRRLHSLDKKKIIIGIVAVAVIVAAVVFANNRGMFGEGKAAVVTYASDSKTGYRTYGNEYLQYTRDGVKYFSKSGEQLWSDGYVMTSPVVVQKGDCTAIFETDGRLVKVYNSKGSVCSVQTDNAIVAVSVNKNGYTAVITSGDSYAVSVYNSSGSLIFQRIEADSGVYPFNCDISPNGEIIAIAYVDVSGVEIDSKIGLFYVNAEKGAAYTDSMFAAVDKSDEIIFYVFFMGDGGLIAVGDRNIMYVSSSGTMSWNIEVTNEINGAAVCGDNVMLVYGNELPDKEGQEPGTIVIISSGGKQSFGYCIGSEADYFEVSDGGAVVGNGSEYFGINSSGSLVWDMNDSGSINGIYPTNNVKKCIYAAKTWSVEADMTNFNPSSYIKNDNNAGTENMAEAVQDTPEDNNADNATADDGTNTTDTNADTNANADANADENTADTQNGDTGNAENTGNTENQ